MYKATAGSRRNEEVSNVSINDYFRAALTRACDSSSVNTSLQRPLHVSSNGVVDAKLDQTLISQTQSNHVLELASPAAGLTVYNPPASQRRKFCKSSHWGSPPPPPQKKKTTHMVVSLAADSRARKSIRRYSVVPTADSPLLGRRCTSDSPVIEHQSTVDQPTTTDHPLTIAGPSLDHRLMSD